MSAHSQERRNRWRALGASIALSVLGASCALPPGDVENQTHRYPNFGLEDSQPADMAVVPIRDLSDEGGAPVVTLRRELYQGLVAKLYSPLDLDFVDVHWVEAGFAPEGLDSGGVLEVVIQEWDTSLLGTHGSIRVSFRAEMLDGRRPGAEPLWGGHAKRRLELASDQVNLSGPALFDRAAEMVAQEILALIPPRDPKSRP